MGRKVFIFSNELKKSVEIAREAAERFIKLGFSLASSPDEDVELIINIGGDGTLLALMQTYEFPTVPIAGINTGHLGFFQEISPDGIDEFINRYIKKDYLVQPYNIVKADVIFEDGREIEHRALNEFVIRGQGTHPIHLNISVNRSFIEKFSGDGIIVSTPAGSTAYNYSLGGALVDPRLNLLQVAPMAPMNNTAYRSLTSSILLPSKDRLIIEPVDEKSSNMAVLFDGMEESYKGIKSITLNLSRRKINLIRYGEISFWDKVKTKFL